MAKAVSKKTRKTAAKKTPTKAAKKSVRPKATPKAAPGKKKSAAASKKKRGAKPAAQAKSRSASRAKKAAPKKTPQKRTTAGKARAAKATRVTRRVSADIRLNGSGSLQPLPTAPVAAPPPPRKPARAAPFAPGAVPPATHVPSGEELRSVRQLLTQFAQDIINGLTLTDSDLAPLFESFESQAPSPMEAWLLWRSFEANIPQFTLPAVREVRRFLTTVGVGTPAARSAQA